MRTAGITKCYARMIGLVYLLFFLASMLSDRLLSGLVVQGMRGARVQSGTTARWKPLVALAQPNAGAGRL
jgi:hypothetical protein